MMKPSIRQRTEGFVIWSKNNRIAKKIMRSAPWRDFGGLLLEAAESPAQVLRTL